MNIKISPTLIRTSVAVAVASALLAACAAVPMKPAGSAEVRNKLTQLQSDPTLANRATVAAKDADAAVRAAEVPQLDAPLARHLVLIADRKVDTARALAETSRAEEQREVLSKDREKSRLDARTHEADVAKGQVVAARADAASSQLQTAELQRQATEMQRQIDAMNAKVTDRGVVLTLGDVLFTTGRADLKVTATGNLNKLVTFLASYPNRTVVVEGYTDDVGSDLYNQGLSQRRADGVKDYLVGQGVGATRLTSLGKGESGPVAENTSAEGRQQNRRVEVIINNPPAASL